MVCNSGFVNCNHMIVRGNVNVLLLSIIIFMAFGKITPVKQSCFHHFSTSPATVPVQTNPIILNFSKGFVKVPHIRLHFSC